jgi:magnesium chelatase family protein
VSCDARLAELSKAIRGQVEAAREKQRPGFEGNGDTCNADMGASEVRQFCQVDTGGHSLLRAEMQQLGMTARSYRRILELARTIADRKGAKDIATHHLAKAMSIRPASRARHHSVPASAAAVTLAVKTVCGRPESLHDGDRRIQ